MSTATLTAPRKLFHLPWSRVQARLDTLDFAARVRRRMRTDRNPLLITLQDKLAAKAYAAQRGVNSAPVLAVAQKTEELDLDALPANCFLKATHGCGWNIARINGTFHRFADGSQLAAGQSAGATTELTSAACLAQCQQWLDRCYSRREWAYGRIAPRIVVEETLQPRAGQQLHDYRLYAFGGVVRAIGIGSPEYRSRGWNVHFDRRWQPIIHSLSAQQHPTKLPPRPAHLSDMLSAAERLSAEIDFVRVDLYDTVDGIMLGEMTVYPYGGKENRPTGCPRFDGWLGSMWK